MSLTLPVPLLLEFLQKLKSDYIEFEEVESADQVLEAIHKLKDDKLVSEKHRLTSETKLQKTYDDLFSLRKSVAEFKAKEETHNVVTGQLAEMEKELERTRTESKELRDENDKLKERLNQTYSDGASNVSTDSVSVFAIYSAFTLTLI